MCNRPLFRHRRLLCVWCFNLLLNWALSRHSIFNRGRRRHTTSRCGDSRRRQRPGMPSSRKCRRMKYWSHYYLPSHLRFPLVFLKREILSLLNSVVCKSVCHHQRSEWSLFFFLFPHNFECMVSQGRWSWLNLITQGFWCCVWHQELLHWLMLEELESSFIR